MSKMRKRYHDTARRVIIEKKEKLEDKQLTLKRLIANVSRASPYGDSASRLMKEQHRIKEQIKDLELSLKVLKQDAQSRIEADWELEQATKRDTAQRSFMQGSYNCLGGC